MITLFDATAVVRIYVAVGKGVNCHKLVGPAVSTTNHLISRWGPVDISDTPPIGFVVCVQQPKKSNSNNRYTSATGQTLTKHDGPGQWTHGEWVSKPLKGVSR